MNNEKLNMQDLIAGIADKTGETKKDADLFLREFVSLIQEALLQDKTLKITGLGTFKLQWNESRKSVNVQTGEEIEIAGHHKIVFSPETELKDAVNEPFAHLETIIIGDSEESKEELPNPLTGLSVQAQEIASMIAEIKAMPTEVEPEKTEEHTNSNHIMEQIIPTQQPQETSTAVFPEVSKPIEEETAFDTSQVDTPETEEITEENPPKKKKKRVWLWILLVLLVLLIAGATICYFTPNCHCFYYDSGQKTSGAVWADSIKALEADTLTHEQAYYSDTDTEVQIEENNNTPPAYPFNISDYPTKNVTVGDGGRLAQVARTHYGNYIFWGYIYLANRDKLSSPDAVKAGMQVKVPQLPSALTDSNNHYAMEQARYINSHLDEY